ncbi:diaminopimelate decarboxylase [Cystobacter fuscus DSM 2262]|uniref:Diaminopimelate decarboxylase n=1 Tax=Cystobacter fuscus (strain ATCC 25194 / DSM 2262 / NBRC 100088 / M29) TaxID=1242864 RepID=S9P2H8_CYSF2|nr:diaminopimelate decarboxylase [Cystobacter fuscus DSM 2262]
MHHAPAPSLRVPRPGSKAKSVLSELVLLTLKVAKEGPNIRRELPLKRFLQ